MDEEGTTYQFTSRGGTIHMQGRPGVLEPV